MEHKLTNLGETLARDYARLMDTLADVAAAADRLQPIYVTTGAENEGLIMPIRF